MGATAIFNYLRRAGVVVIAEGLHLTETRVPRCARRTTLAEAAIPSETGCNVVALRTKGQLRINPEPSTILEDGAEIILIGTPEAEQRSCNCMELKSCLHSPSHHQEISAENRLARHSKSVC